MPKKEEWDKWIDDTTQIKNLYGWQRFSDGTEVEFKYRNGIIYYRTQGDARYKKIVPHLVEDDGDNLVRVGHGKAIP